MRLMSGEVSQSRGLQTEPLSLKLAPFASGWIQRAGPTGGRLLNVD